MIAPLFITLLLLMLLGAPIAVAIGVAPIVAMISGGMTQQLFITAQRMVTGIDSTVLMAIPLFVFAGGIMGKGGISKQIVNMSYELFGWIPGSLGVVNVIACMFFAAISGSAPATVAAIGGLMIPSMIDDGYPAGYAGALSAAAGVIGCIIPPSIPFVNYGLITQQSVSELFAAGAVPGILMGIGLCVFNSVMAVKHGWGSRNKGIDLKKCGKTFVHAFWALLTPIIILGGIYGGIFTPTEAAAVSCVYGLLAGLFIYKGFKFPDVVEVAYDSVKSSAMILFIVATANIFSFIVTKEQVPAKLANLIMGVTDNWVIVLLMINIILLINGCFLETTASTYIYTPILYPLIMQLGYDPVQFGAVMVMNLTMGLITPPLGVNLFVAAGIDERVTLNDVIKYIWGLFGVELAVLLLITYIPSISLFLVNMIRQ